MRSTARPTASRRRRRESAPSRRRWRGSHCWLQRAPRHLPASWTIADRGAARRGDLRRPAGRRRGALYLPAGVRPGRAPARCLSARGASRRGRSGRPARARRGRRPALVAAHHATVRGRRDLGAGRARARRRRCASRSEAAARQRSPRAGRVGVGLTARPPCGWPCNPAWVSARASPSAMRIPGALVRSAERAVRAHRVRIYRPAGPAAARGAAAVRHELLRALIRVRAGSAGRASRAAEAVAPHGWVRIAVGPYGGTVWQGVIPNHADPGHPRRRSSTCHRMSRRTLRYPGAVPAARPARLALQLRRRSAARCSRRRADPRAPRAPLHRRAAAGRAVAAVRRGVDGPVGALRRAGRRALVRPPSPARGRASRAHAGRLLRRRTAASTSAAASRPLRHAGVVERILQVAQRRIARDTRRRPSAWRHDPQALLPAARPSCAQSTFASFSRPARASRRPCSRRARSRASSPASASTTCCDVTAGGHHGRAWRAVLPAGLLYALAR